MSVSPSGVAVLCYSVVSLAFLTLYFLHGQSMEVYDKTHVPANDVQALLDTYNSYSGAAASAVQRPVAIFVGFVAQVVALRHVFLPEPSPVVSISVLASGAVLGFLGSNSLNVQVSERPLEALVQLSDVGRNSSDFQVTSTSLPVSEATRENPITNTVLHNHAYLWCAGVNGTEQFGTLSAGSTRDFNIICNEFSSTSLLMLGVGKRLTAEVLNNTNSPAVATANLLKFYSFTVGRLSGRYEDLAKLHHAECKASDRSGLV